MVERARFARILLPLFLLLISSVVPAASQDGQGDELERLSIDCGSNANYTDTKKLHWVTDEGYIDTGRNGPNLTVQSPEIIVNGQQAQSLRYFDDGRSRSCYVLPVTPRNTYLVRPTFYYGDWKSPSNSTAFDVYLDNNLWLNFQFDQDTLKDYTYVYEALVYVNRPKLDVCLVRRQGTPFISSLELRELASGMYTSVLGDRKYLGMSKRVNTGSNTTGPLIIRYPDDVYDRLWYSFPDNSTHIRNTSDLPQNSNLTPERPPLKVMQDASVYYSTNYYTYLVTYNGGSVGPIAVYSYFQEVDGNATATNRRSMDYYLNDVRIDSFTLSPTDPYEVRTCELTVSGTYVNISLYNTSRLQAIINALEIYLVYDWNVTTTSDVDVPIIASIQVEFNLTDWFGDPCVPVPYDWLNCSSFAESQASGTTVNNQTGLSVVPDRTSYVTGLSLANIATIQTLPGGIANLSKLISLNLSNSGLASLGLSAPPTLTVLDLSHNRFSGGALEFIQTVNVTTLQTLYAESNELEGEFPLQQLYAEFPDLVEANFDDNPKITGTLDLSSWHAALQSVLQNDTTTSTLATTSTPADRVPTPSPEATTSGIPLVSLRNNGIRDINPSLDVLSSDINRYLGDYQRMGSNAFNNYGVLLGGNPWCQQKAFSALPLPQQYLCRNSRTDILPGLAGLSSSKKGDKLGASIGGSVGGLAFVLACVSAFAIWRSWKTSSSLREVQEALAKQKVQPPFYSYADLRAATNDFSLENKLGQGTFGDVYKGTLVDANDGTRSEQLAVKRLYPSKQALSEFLNETVLITGIKHRNLVQLKGCCVHKEDQRMLVYEYAENGNLAESLWVEASKKDVAEQELRTILDWHQRLNICLGMARGLSYLHEELQPRIIHRDIKPYNVLLDKNFNAKIADFGLARSIMEGEAEADFTKIAGTTGYFAPEYATQGQLTEKADVFSFGVVLLEIVSGRKGIDPRLPGQKQFLQGWARHLKDEGKLLDLLDPAIRKTADGAEVIQVINLAFTCLDFYPEKRPRMSKAVSTLQAILDVTLYKPDDGIDTPGYRSNYSPAYTRLTHLVDSTSEERPSDSFDMSTTSTTSGGTNPDRELKMKEISGR